MTLRAYRELVVSLLRMNKEDLRKKKSKNFERFLLSVLFTFPGIIVCFCQCLIKQREIISNEQNNYIFNIAMLEV